MSYVDIVEIKEWKIDTLDNLIRLIRNNLLISNIYILKDTIRSKFRVVLYIYDLKVPTEEFDMNDYDKVAEALKERKFIRISTQIFYDKLGLRQIISELWTHEHYLRFNDP